MSVSRKGQKRAWLAGMAVLALTVVAGVLSTTAGAASGGAVALLMSDSTTARWFEQDVPNITKAIKALSPSTKVLQYNAGWSPDKQLTQARTAIGQGAKVLVVTSVDTIAAGQIVKFAHANGVKVIAYEHQILKSPIDYYVGFDPLEVGHQEGKWMAANTKKGDGIVLINGWTATSLAHVFKQGYMKYLGPLFKSGERTLVAEYWTTQWLASNAQNEMEAVLAKGKQFAAVLAENDQMAGGVVAALKGAGLAGKVKVTGLDADLAALQRILNGTQHMTIYPRFAKEARDTAQIAVALLNGKQPPASVVGTRTLPNGIGGRTPWIVAPTIPITANTMDVVVKDRYVTRAELCKGAASADFCQR
jgi:D-xylose transport system substrate-binding protein